MGITCIDVNSSTQIIIWSCSYWSNIFKYLMATGLSFTSWAIWLANLHIFCNGSRKNRRVWCQLNLFWDKIAVWVFIYFIFFIFFPTEWEIRYYLIVSLSWSILGYEMTLSFFRMIMWNNSATRVLIENLIAMTVNFLCARTHHTSLLFDRSTFDL